MRGFRIEQKKKWFALFGEDWIGHAGTGIPSMCKLHATLSIEDCSRQNDFFTVNKVFEQTSRDTLPNCWNGFVSDDWSLVGHDRSWQKVNNQLWAKAADKNFHFHCVNFRVTMSISVEANHRQRQITSDRLWLTSGQQVTNRHQQKKCFDDAFQHFGPVSQFSTTMRLEHASLPIVSCASGSWLRTVATVSLWTQNLISRSADTAG